MSPKKTLTKKGSPKVNRAKKQRPIHKHGKDEMPIMRAQGLTKAFGKVVALDNSDFDLYKGEVLAIIGDNGAGKSTLIKALSGALIPDEGKIYLEDEEVHFTSPLDARQKGIETVYQNLAVCPSLDISSNLYLGREKRKKGVLGTVFRMLDQRGMKNEAERSLSDLGLLTIRDIAKAVETLSGGQRQGVAVARATVFGSKVVIMDEPTAALGVKESARVLDLINDVKSDGTPVVLISHNMPHVFEIADRIHIHRLGARVAVVRRDTHTMAEAVAIMTGALNPEDHPAGAYCD